MATEKLEKAKWQGYFNAMSKVLPGQEAEIEVNSLSAGSQPESEFAPLLGIVYDPQSDMLEVRDGPLSVEPLTDGPLQVRGNLEITSGTGRVVARVQQARLCRCGGSANKPFCDGTHARFGFKST